MAEPKKWGIKNCRERKCSELRKNENEKYPEDARERCQVFNTMPGTLPCCIQDMEKMPPEEFLRHAVWRLHTEWEKELSNRKTPGPKNCPATCPYKISEQGEVFKKTTDWKKVPGTIWKCAFSGSQLGSGLGGGCHCHVLDNPDQEKQIEALETTCILRKGANFYPEWCWTVGCPDGVVRCKEGGIICPVIKLPFTEIRECPLWRIPAKLLPAPAAAPVQKTAENVEKTTPTENQKRAKAIREEVHQVREEMKRMSEGKSRIKSQRKTKPAEPAETPAPEKKRAKKEKTDPVCDHCRERMKGNVPDHACEWCKEEQAKKGGRAWVTSLELGQVHCGDMNELGNQVPTDSVDLIFTDPPYVKELYEQAYANLAELALRVLKPHGFLITYAPQTHLDEIMDMLRCNGTWRHGGRLHYFWVIQSINGGAQTAKNHHRNAICLHKPILVFQKAREEAPLKGARRCFADVVRGLKQKKYHPWQQSVHDVLGIIDRFMAPGEILLDPYAGWGTSLIAANLLGMQWVGFEIEPERAAIAMQRLQQRPVALDTFGIEAEAAECEREPAPEPEDRSRQEKLGDPDCRHTNGKNCNIHGVECNGKERGCRKHSTELPPICKECEVLGDCNTKDPRAGCADTVRAIIKAREEKDAATVGRHPAGPGGPQTGACGTCGHHKGRKTFHESCPRLGELLFKGGTKSAKVLMEETQRTACEHWVVKGSTPAEIYGSDKKEIPSPSAETCPGNCPYKIPHPMDKFLICAFTGKALIEMKECPTPVLCSENQEFTMNAIRQAIDRQREEKPSETRCQCFTCPDGVMRCGIGDKVCPDTKEPFRKLRRCPQMAIPEGYLFPGKSKRSASRKSKKESETP